MDCEAFRERISIDPTSMDRECRAHAAACSACAAFATRLKRNESLIEKALRFDVAAMREPAARVRPQTIDPPGRLAWAGIAAVLVAALVLWQVIGRSPSLPPEALAAAVVEHWYHEPASWRETNVVVSAEVMNGALAGIAAVDVDRLGLVTYARSCYVAGRWIPHLVVQGRQGPVMVLLLPRTELAARLPLSLPEQQLTGTLVPVGDGSIAILGEEGEALDSLERRMVEAVQWAI